MPQRIITLIALFISLNCFAQFKDVKIGDVLTVNGVSGIVFKVDDNGTHGQMMSVKAYRGKKDLFCSKSSYLKNLSMRNEHDGKQNTEELYKYCESNNFSLTAFPVFNWCKSLGPDWYIPSILQIKEFVNYWLGNNDLVMAWDDEDEEEGNAMVDATLPHSKTVDKILLEAGGIPFLNGVFSSTMDEKHKVDILDYNKEEGKWKFKKVNPMKIDKFCVGRAFYNF